MRGISWIFPAACILLVPLAGKDAAASMLEPSNYIGFYDDMNRNYITLDEYGPFHFFDVYTWMYAGPDGMMCAQYKATVPSNVMVLDGTSYNTGVISHTGSPFGSPGMELCFDTCREGWIFVSNTPMMTTTGTSPDDCGPLVTIAPHDETGVKKVSDCGEPSGSHELGSLDPGYINCYPMAVRYHPYIIDLDIVSHTLLDIEYHVELVYVCTFYLYKEGDTSQSIPVTRYDWQVEGSVLRVYLGSPMIDGTTYILEAFGRSLNGRGMASWKRFLFDASVATLLQSYDVYNGENGIVLTWELAEDPDNPLFTVSRREPGDNFIGLPSEEIRSDDNRYIFNDGGVEPGKEYVYKVDFISGSSSGTLFITEPIETPAVSLALENYPNPFNPSTVIEYTLPAACSAKIAVYDIDGSKVRTLLDRFQSAGRHATVWDGTDDSGHGVSSGVYLCRIVAGRQILSRKMVLIR